MSRRMLVSAAAVGLALALQAPAVAQDFEGVIKTRTISVDAEALYDRTNGDPALLFELPVDEVARSSDAHIESITLYLKGSKIRAEGTGMGQAGSGAYMTIDYAAGVFRTVQPAQQMYMEWTMEDLEKIRQEIAGDLPPEVMQPELDRGPEPAVRPLGKTRTVNGIRTEGYEVRTGDEVTWLWVTKQHPDANRAFQRFMEQADRMDNMDGASDWDPATLAMRYGLPVLTQSVDLYEGSAGGDYDIDEVSSIEPQAVSDVMFEPPAGYKKTSMAEMMGGMMEQMMELEEKMKDPSENMDEQMD